MTDTAVLAAVSALSKKVDGIGSNEVIDLPINYTTVDKSEGNVTQVYVPNAGVPYNPAVAVLGNDIYFIGGDDGNSIVYSTAFKYNIGTGVVTPIADYPQVITYAKATVWNGKVVVVGGQTVVSFGSSVRTETYMYDPATNTWTSTNGTPYNTTPLGVFTSTNSARVTSIGGYGGSAPSYAFYKDMPSGSWNSVSSMSSLDGGVAVQIGNVAWAFAGNGGQTYSMALDTSTVTAKANSPVGYWYRAKGAVVGTKVYVMNSEYNSGYYQNHYEYDTVANTWTQKANLPYSTSGNAVASVGTKVYLFRGGALSVHEFDPTANTWTAKSNAPTNIKGYASPQVIGNDIYVPSVTGSLMKYTATTDTWSVVYASLPVSSPATVSVGNKIYAFGGIIGGTSYQSTSYVYDVTTKLWTQLANMPRTRAASGTGVAYVNGKIYVMGGYNGSSYVTNTDIYDIATNTWSAGAARPGTSLMSANAAANGKIYATTNTRYVNIYDPVANSWTLSSQNPVSRNSWSSAILNNKVYVFNSSVGFDVYDIATDSWTAYTTGGDVNQGNFFTYNNELYVINTSTDSINKLNTGNAWTTVARTNYNNVGLDEHQLAAALVGDTLYFIGPHGINPMATYNVANGYWNSVTPYGNTLMSQFATASKDGNLYVVGYSTNTAASGGQNGVLKYDAKMNYWTYLASLPVGAFSSPGTAIWNNNLYVFGGQNTSGTALTNVYEVNLSSGLVTTKTAMSAATQYVMAATVGDYIWVLRGSDGQLWRYAPATDTWLQVMSIGTFYSGMAAGMVSDGEYVYFLGGGSSPYTTFRRFEPATGILTTLTNMPAAHSSGSATYADGKIFVTGGSEKAPNHVYDIATGVWSTFNSPMNIGRQYGGTEYVDGKIVSFGGYPYGTSTLFSYQGMESFAIPYRVLNQLAITKPGVYYSLTPGITLTNSNSGRSGDSVAAAGTDVVYPVGPSVGKRIANAIRLLKT